MQIESADVKVARKGQLIGIKVDKIVVVGDKVYKESHLSGKNKGTASIVLESFNGPP